MWKRINEIEYSVLDVADSEMRVVVEKVMASINLLATVVTYDSV